MSFTPIRETLRVESSVFNPYESTKCRPLAYMARSLVDYVN